jgi:EAL and modified HD-GYP domain-containing signal transduction protein
VRLVAHNLQSHYDFLFSHKSGFDYFHGPFVSSPVRIKPGGGINRLVVLPILNMVRADKSFALIAEQIKSEPTLTFKLLRYLKSPAMGLQGQVDNLTSALALVGRARFYRWMSLLLFDFTNPSYQERLLSERALTRGRTLELLAGQGRIPNIPEVLFLTGLF